MILDLRESDYESWVNAVFDHPVPTKRNSDEWYHAWDLEILVDPERQLRFLSRLCREAHGLVGQFSPEQIDQGLWFMFGAGGAQYFWRHFWNSNVEWDLRQECILAIPALWPELFERTDVGTMSYMVWDSLAYDYDGGPLNSDGDPEARRVQDAMFRALTEQLTSDVPETQSAALHGLGHLRHRSTARELERFLRRPHLDEEVRNYAREIRKDERLL